MLTLSSLRCAQFVSGEATTSFIGTTPELFEFVDQQNRGQKLLNYLGDLVVNGRTAAGASGPVTPRVTPLVPPPPTQLTPKGLKQAPTHAPMSGVRFD